MKGGVCELLPWDTEFFGFNIARVRGHSLTPHSAVEAIEWCRGNAIRCLYFLADSGSKESIDTVSELSFSHVDDRLTYSAPTSSLDARIDSGIRKATESDIPRLREIAAMSHADSRFFNDLHFDRARCRELYARWIENSVNGWADAVFVAEAHGAVQGYITCSRDDTRGSIGLVAVGDSARGKGIAKSLMGSAIEWFKAESLGEVHVVTQGRNAAARAFYDKAGFQLVDNKMWFHKWFD